MRFTKMHGLGNDYVYVNCFQEKVPDPAKTAIIVSDRHRGIGADGLILICPSNVADVKMQMFNADGSQAQMCGNGIRCVAKYAYEHNLTKSKPPSLTIETGRGVLTLGLEINKNNKVEKVCVNMGQPILEPSKVPVLLEGDSIVEAAIDVRNQRMLMTCVSMGNPHAVFFTDDLDSINIEKVGHIIENHELFPERINAHFVRVNSRNDFTMITWERGSGVTLACGTGACACCVAAVLTERSDRNVTAHLPGGDLQIEWSQKDNCVYMTGPATEVFTGVWPEDNAN
ncbi:MAG: diaminopimelate epimerase [Planctomycetes bacterium GWF2_41_51]|nr:MAG: diaminopimelate epimerase [Planctomycetes bacterium GWF2_41_51]HBG25761.1 diaminopimelate epimerase [Phycisphaerales bacterium]